MKSTLICLFLFMGFGWYAAQQKSVFDIARSGTLTELQDLIKHNPDAVNSANEHGFTPLILACYRGNTTVAKYLIDHGADINYRSPEGTALAGLCIRYNRELVEALLARNANVNIADSNGTTPLMWAIKTRNEELVKLLLIHGADVSLADKAGIKPFEFALQTHDDSIINLLKNH